MQLATIVVKHACPFNMIANVVAAGASAQQAEHVETQIWIWEDRLEKSSMDGAHAEHMGLSFNMGQL